MKNQYVLEYSKKQDAYHIHTEESRSKCFNNHDWEVVICGSYDECSSKYKHELEKNDGAENG